MLEDFNAATEYPDAATAYLVQGLHALRTPQKIKIDAALAKIMAEMLGVEEAMARIAELDAMPPMLPPKLMAFPDGDFVQMVAALYTPEEQQFLRVMGERFPRVKLGFSYFGLLGKNERPFEAIAVTAKQHRTGWLRIGVPTGYVQSVMDHHKSGEKLADMLYAEDPQLALIKDVFRYHDIGEAVISDFTPHCPITKDEKIQLEEMAVRLIVGRRAGVWVNPMAEAMDMSFRIYEGMIPGHDELRVKVKDLDLVEMIFEAAMIRHACPPGERAAIDAGLIEFEAYVGARLQTPQAKAFHDGLINPEMRYKRPEQVWAHAYRHMRKNVPAFS